jgi:hypothetical protein
MMFADRTFADKESVVIELAVKYNVLLPLNQFAELEDTVVYAELQLAELEETVE